MNLMNAGLTIAFALAGGVLAQVIATHLRIPGIVLLLAVGVALGPDGLGLIWPQTLGAGLTTLVGFAVAVILFEGGMNLNLGRLRREQRPIRQLVSLGALVTALGGTLTAKIFLGWEWRTCILFGTLVIVTGPTVIQPLLRRIRVHRSVATVLEAEGVLGDAIGALTASVALEIATQPSGASIALGPIDLLARLGFGLGFGAVAGLVFAWLLRFRHLIPEELQNIFTLSLVFALFQGANVMMHETGIPAVTAAGIVVGNFKGIRVQRDLLEFKEQLTVLLIGLLFVLLAADVRVEEVRSLGVAGLAAVATLMLVVRPLNVLVGTWGTHLTWRQKTFIAWIGPRGIVAAAVASFFAAELAEHDIAGGAELRALVFMVIAVTVVSAGLTGGFMARLLRLRRVTAGWVILGANELGRELAKVLGEGGQDVVSIDSNPDASHAAEEAGLRVLFGNGLDERVLLRAGIETRAGALAVTPSDEANYLFVRRAKEEGRVRRLAAAIGSNARGATVDMVQELGGDVLFGQVQDVDLWCVRLRRKLAHVELWGRTGKRGGKEDSSVFEPFPNAMALLLALRRGDKIEPITSSTRLRPDDLVSVLIHDERAEEARSWLVAHGWQPETTEAAESAAEATAATS